MKIRKPFIKTETLASTNDYALDMIAHRKAAEGMVIMAVNQEKGKGLENNKWESEPGKNLTISIIIQPETLIPARQFMLNKITSLAVRDFVLAQLPQQQVYVKWPNDVYIENKKVAGILINNTIEGNKITWSVVGIGVNINQTVFRSNAPNPVSLKQISRNDHPLDVCLQELCDAFEKRYTQLSDGKSAIVDNDYLQALYRFGTLSHFICKGKEIEAEITGIGEFGHLCLQTLQGEYLQCDLKEIKFRD